MSLSDVLGIWRESVSIEGIEFVGGLRAILEEDQDLPRKRRKLSNVSTSYIRRVRLLAEFLEDLERKHKNTRKAIEEAEALRSKENGTKIALWRFAESISQKSNS